METSLHRSLKQTYASDPSQVEQQVGRFRIDVIRDGELIEIQHASLAAIRAKVTTLLRNYQVRVVKPLIARKQIVRCQGKGRPVVSRRRSPKQGSILDIFDELIYFRHVFPHPKLILEVPLIHVEEWRYTARSGERGRRWKKKDVVEDRRLVEIVGNHEFRSCHDLLRLLPADLPSPFDTQELATGLGVDRWIAQRIAYCLRHMRGLKLGGKRGNAVLYRKAS